MILFIYLFHLWQSVELCIGVVCATSLVMQHLGQEWSMSETTVSILPYCSCGITLMQLKFCGSDIACLGYSLSFLDDFS